MSVRRLAAVSLVAALLLGGCSDDPEPRFEDEPSESPSLSEVTTSAAAEKQTAEEFVREWISAYNEFEDSGEPTRLRELGAACGTCDDIIELVADAYRRGGYVRSDGWSISGALQEQYIRPEAAGYRGTIQVAPSRFKPSAQAKVQRGTGGDVTMEFDLRKIDGVWKMADLTRRPT